MCNCVSVYKCAIVIRNKIAGTYRQLLRDLNLEKIDTSNPKVNNENDIDDLMNLAKATLSHNCEKADFRCHKKCDNSGKTICRFKIFEPSNETFFKLIERPHSEEAWEILHDLGLAKLVEGFENLYEVSNELKAGKYNYAADFGETFSPVVSKIFSVGQCSMNCLLCDVVMSASYLAKYAAGVEEHAEVNVGESNNIWICSLVLKGLLSLLTIVMISENLLSSFFLMLWRNMFQIFSSVFCCN